MIGLPYVNQIIEQSNTNGGIPSGGGATAAYGGFASSTSFRTPIKMHGSHSSRREDEGIN
mgnify:CR=1 FL=1